MYFLLSIPCHHSCFLHQRMALYTLFHMQFIECLITLMFQRQVHVQYSYKFRFVMIITATTTMLLCNGSMHTLSRFKIPKTKDIEYSSLVRSHFILFLNLLDLLKKKISITIFSITCLLKKIKKKYAHKKDSIIFNATGHFSIQHEYMYKFKKVINSYIFTAHASFCSEQSVRVCTYLATYI